MNINPITNSCYPNNNLSQSNSFYNNNLSNATQYSHPSVPHGNSLNLSLEAAQAIRKNLLKKISKYELYIRKEIKKPSGCESAFIEKLRNLTSEFNYYNNIISNFIGVSNNHSIDSLSTPFPNSSYINNRSLHCKESEMPYIINKNGINNHIPDIPYHFIEEIKNKKSEWRNFSILVIDILKKYPKITISYFSKVFHRLTNKNINFSNILFKDLLKMFEDIPGVEINASNNGVIELEYKKICCFPFRASGKCECGLNCDGRRYGITVGWRNKQCDAENSKAGCPAGANCNDLHTKSYYK